MVTVAGGLVLWIALGDHLGPPGELVWFTSLAYPVMNMLLLALIVWIITSPVAVLDAVISRWLALSIAALLIADTVFGLSDSSLNFQDRLFSMGYLTMYAGWTGAGVRAASRPEPPAPSQETLLSPLWLLGMYAALLVVPTILLIDYLNDHQDSHLPLAVASFLLSVLVPARMWLSMRQLVASTRQSDAFRDDLAHQAAHDHLTDLPNRAYLMELLSAQMHRARRSGSEVALLFVDLDFFKRVNDQLGHAAGDEVLRTTADRMKSVLRAGDVLARQGGDEFVVLIDRCPPRPS